MPMMDLTLEKGALTAEAKARLMDELTAVLLEFEGPGDREPVRPITHCFVDELPARTNLDRPYGGRPVYQILLTVPECDSGHGGAPRPFRRERLMQRVTELVLNAEGTPVTPSESLRVRVQVREIREGFFDACGEILRIDDGLGDLLPTPERGSIRP
jgi:phenylpyruvate tautomerase PptA (4-oxalocrotonate tautomerase family)